MYLSVEISSYNRWPVLQQVLACLALQGYPKDGFEVVVSDDNSTDGTRERLREYALKAPFSMRLVENEVNGGCGTTHNSGIRAASGDIVLMIADDVLPTPGLLEEHARLHILHPQPEVGVVGRLQQSPTLPSTRFQKTWDPLVNSIFPHDRTEVDYRDFWVNNLSFKRKFMLEHGMFHSWPVGAHEDVELGYRLQQHGMRLLFSDKALAYHHHPETIDSVARRSYAQGYNWDNFESFVPERWVRTRSGNFRPGDGMAARLRFWVKLGVRAALFNQLTVPHVVMPLVRAAETNAFLAPVVPLSVGRVASYFFRKGLVDRRQGRSSSFAGGLSMDKKGSR